MTGEHGDPLGGTDYFIREQVAFVKLTDTYDIFDGQTQQQIAVASDDPGSVLKWLRVIINKRLLPTDIKVAERVGGPLLFHLEKGPSFIRVKADVVDASGRTLGRLVSKFFSLGGGFWIHDARGNKWAEVKGDWKGWNFEVRSTGGESFGTISKKWAGLAKELFTSADNYGVRIAGRAAEDRDLRILVLAAALAVDMVFKERQ